MGLGNAMHRRQDPIPACGVEDRTHILTTLHLGLDLIPHVPGTGPNPHYLAHSTTTRTRRLTTTFPFGLRLRQSSIAALFRACVCVQTPGHGDRSRAGETPTP